MSDGSFAGMRKLLVQRYDEIRQRLSWRLGSSELAADALHDTWVRLSEREPSAGEIKNPMAYLMRMATNVALDRLGRDKRYLDVDEMEQLIGDLCDRTPGPEERAGAHDEIRLLVTLIESMPARRRAIFLAVRVEGLSNRDAAACFGVSERLVGLELKRAHEFCLSHLPEWK